MIRSFNQEVSPRVMQNRREFIRTGAAMVALASGATPLVAAQSSDKVKPSLRTITYNILACKGYPERKANRDVLARARTQMPQRLAMELALYEPDIVTFQESPSEDVVAGIAEYLAMSYVYFPGGWPGTLVTKLKILESENCPFPGGPCPKELFTRHWGRAVLQSDTETIAFYSAHLHPFEVATREKEITAALEVMKADIKSKKSLLFQGDLNHTPDGPDYPRWIRAGLVDTFEREGVGKPYTAQSTSPVRRIDYVWAHGPLAGRIQECRVLFEGAFRTNRDDYRSFALSDHLPVMTTFS